MIKLKICNLLEAESGVRSDAELTDSKRKNKRNAHSTGENANITDRLQVDAAVQLNGYCSEYRVWSIVCDHWSAHSGLACIMHLDESMLPHCCDTLKVWMNRTGLRRRSKRRARVQLL